MSNFRNKFFKRQKIFFTFAQISSLRLRENQNVYNSELIFFFVRGKVHFSTDNNPESVRDGQMNFVENNK